MVRVSHPHASTAYAILQCASSPTDYSHDWPSETAEFEVALRPAKKTHVLGKCAPTHKVTETRSTTTPKREE